MPIVRPRPSAGPFVVRVDQIARETQDEFQTVSVGDPDAGTGRGRKTFMKLGAPVQILWTRIQWVGLQNTAVYGCILKVNPLYTGPKKSPGFSDPGRIAPELDSGTVEFRGT